MRSTATTPHSASLAGLPRAWPIAGLALVSWLVFAGLWMGAAQLFALVAAAL